MFTNKHPFIRKFAFILLLLTLFGYTTNTFADEPAQNEEEELFDMPIEELMQLEVGTVYTASKFEQKTTEAPSSVTVLTSDDIKMYGWRSLADILRSVKGFYTSYDRSYEHLGVRGFCLPGDETSRVLILLDGFRMNENVRGHGAIGNEFLLDVDLIDRIEIVRGPGSSLYGGNAIFGVINIITKKGEDYKGTEFAGDMEINRRFRRFEAQRGRLTYGKVFENGMDFLISATLFERDGQYLFFPHFVEPPAIYGNTKNDDEVFRSFFTKLTFDEFTLEAGHNNRKKVIPTAPLGAVFETDWNQTKRDKSTFVGLTYNHDFSDTSSVMAKLSYNDYKYHRHLWYTSEMWDEFFIADPWTYDRKGTWWNGELQFTAEPIENHKVTWGAEFQYNGRQDQDMEIINTDANGIVSWNTEQSWSKHMNSKRWGFYIQDQYRASDTLTLNAGVRYDNYDIAEGVFSPRFAVIKNLSDATTLKLLYGKAFRPPTPFELYYQYDHLSQEAALDLDSETIETYEIVLEHYLKPNLRASLSGFHYKLHDFISNHETLPGQPEGTNWKNSGMAMATGLEFGLEGKWKNGVMARASYSFVDPEFKEPVYQTELFWDDEEEEWYEERTAVTGHSRRRMYNAPIHLAKLNLLVPVIKDKVIAGFETQLNSRRRTLGGDKTNNYLLANLTVTCKDIFRENMDFSFGVFNIFNTRYRHPAWGDNELDDINQNGRRFIARLTYRF